jgi:hypothetical protein
MSSVIAEPLAASRKYAGFRVIAMTAILATCLVTSIAPDTTWGASGLGCRGHHRVKLTIKGAQMNVNVAWTRRKVDVTGSLLNPSATPASAYVASGKTLLATVSSADGTRARINTRWRRVRPIGTVRAIMLNLVLAAQPPATAGKVVRLR